MLKRFASNAGANIFSGVVSAIYQLTITGIGGSIWEGSSFSSWALALSIAAIAPIFAANLSSVVTRRVVEARHGVSRSCEATILRASRKLGLHISLMALAILFCAGASIQIHAASQILSTFALVALLVIILSTNSWLLLWQVRFGQYYADERNWIPALTLAGARLGGVLGMLLGLAAGHRDLLAAALGLCAGTWIGLAGAFLFLPGPSYVNSQPSTLNTSAMWTQYQANLRLLSGFAVGAVSMLVIQYSIPPLMAVIAPERFNAFYLASTLNTVAASVLGSAMSAMLAPLTRWRVSGDLVSLQRVTLLSPVFCAASCLVVLFACWFSTGPVLSALGVRAASVEDVRVFLAILGLQTVVRNAAAGYAMYIASCGSSSQMASPLLVEIGLAFTVAFPLGWLYGENALLYGLIISGLLGSLYTSRVLASLDPAHRIAASRAFPSLLAAQLLFSGLWWLVARPGL
jgi:hypothetical protein